MSFRVVVAASSRRQIRRTRRLEIYFTIVLIEPNALASGIYQLRPHSEAPEASAYGSK